MNIAIALTAAERGATIANHVEVTGLLKEKDPQTGLDRVVGATVSDVITGESWDVRAKVSSFLKAILPLTFQYDLL